MGFDGFTLDDAWNLVVGDRSLDLHNRTTLIRYSYLAGVRRFELEQAGTWFTFPADGSEIARHEHVLFTFWDVRFLRTQSAPSEHLDSAHLVQFRRISAELLLSGWSHAAGREPRTPLPVQVGNLYTSDELAAFGDDDVYEIGFIHGPDILVSSPRITVDWTSREEATGPPKP